MNARAHVPHSVEPHRVLRRKDAPGPRLYRLKRRLRPWQHADDPEDRLYYKTREWAPLSDPLRWEEVMPRFARTLERLGIASNWLLAPPTVDRSMVDGTDFDEFLWRAGQHQLCALAIDGIRNDPVTGELDVPTLLANLHVALVANDQQ